jgi:uridine kinase
MPTGALGHACEAIVAEANRRMSRRPGPVLVALDGGSGAGKTTLAAAIAGATHAAVVPGDDFYAAEITHDEWRVLDAAERASRAIDWRRLRDEALEPLLAGRSARWHRFDFESGERPDGSYAMRDDFSELLPAPLVVCDGAYSARPELCDLIELSVLVQASRDLRHTRLAAREDAGFLRAWHERWDAAEEHYFTRVRPPSAFDVVVAG